MPNSRIPFAKIALLLLTALPSCVSIAPPSGSGGGFGGYEGSRAPAPTVIGGNRSAGSRVVVDSVPGARPPVSPSSPAASNAPVLAGKSGGQVFKKSHGGYYQQEARPEERPGLGTGWGREVRSTMNYTRFTRASSRPADAIQLHYNNENGARIMAGGNARRVGASLRSPQTGLDIAMVDSRGRVLPAYTKSDGRFVVVGNPGSHYALVAHNRSHQRLEVVFSVDGLDVTDGQAASTNKRGYIIEAGRSLRVEGFRTSEHSVAAFQFSSVAGSYSNQRHGTARNVGVVGVAVYTERGGGRFSTPPSGHPSQWGRDIHMRETSSPFPGNSRW